ncbi:MAG: hypothetical protein ABSG33_12130 [Candidatus Bathyarchaeia archaeon]|jgi:hypothetical protein
MVNLEIPTVKISCRPTAPRKDRFTVSYEYSWCAISVSDVLEEPSQTRSSDDGDMANQNSYSVAVIFSNMETSRDTVNLY